MSEERQARAVREAARWRAAAAVTTVVLEPVEADSDYWRCELRTTHPASDDMPLTVAVTAVGRGGALDLAETQLQDAAVRHFQDPGVSEKALNYRREQELYQPGEPSIRRVIVAARTRHLDVPRERAASVGFRVYVESRGQCTVGDVVTALLGQPHDQLLLPA